MRPLPFLLVLFACSAAVAEPQKPTCADARAIKPLIAAELAALKKRLSSDPNMNAIIAAEAEGVLYLEERVEDFERKNACTVI